MALTGTGLILVLTVVAVVALLLGALATLTPRSRRDLRS